MRSTAHTYLGRNPLHGGRAEKTRARFEPSATIFEQGDRCAGVMCIEAGRVRLSVTSPDGRTAVLAILRAGALFGEGALAGQRRRRSTAEAITACTITVVSTAEVRRRLRREAALADWLCSQVLTCNLRIEQVTVDHVVNQIDQRLAPINRSIVR